jgi:hypothetical protein
MVCRGTVRTWCGRNDGLMEKLQPHLRALVKEIADAAPPLTPERRDLIARIFGRSRRPAAKASS